MKAKFQLLCQGYVDHGVASPISLVIDGDKIIVVDPGMVNSKSRIVDVLVRHGVLVEQVTDVVMGGFKWSAQQAHSVSPLALES